jgi:hypothetical protein
VIALENMPHDPSRSTSAEAKFPSHRMKGWTILSWEEDSDSNTSVPSTLPLGQKRARSQPKRFVDEVEHWKTAKRKATTPPPSRGPSLKDKQERVQPTKIRVGGRFRSKEHNQLEREIKRLKMEIDLLAVAESREIQDLKADVKRLDDLRAIQNKQISALRASTDGEEPLDSITDGTEVIKMKDEEIERQNATIKDLQASLSNALKFDALLSNIRDDELPTTVTADLADEMKYIKLGIIRTAELLSSCTYPLGKSTVDIKIHPDLGDMVRKSIGSTTTLGSMPGLAIRALLFHVIRDQIIHSKVWTALQVEGHMLRAYQEAIQRCGEYQSTSNESATILTRQLSSHQRMF